MRDWQELVISFDTRVVSEVRRVNRKKKEFQVTQWSKRGSNSYGRVEEAVIDFLSDDFDFKEWDEGETLKFLIATLALPYSDWPDKRNEWTSIDKVFGSGLKRYLDFPFSSKELADRILTTSRIDFLDSIEKLRKRRGWQNKRGLLDSAEALFSAIDRSLIRDLALKTMVDGPINSSYPLFPLSSGWPDITAVKNNKIFFFEVKSPSDTMRNSQLRFQENLSDLSFVEFTLVYAKQNEE